MLLVAFCFLSLDTVGCFYSRGWSKATASSRRDGYTNHFCTERKISYYIDVVRLCPLLLGIFILTDADVLGDAMVRTEIPSGGENILNAVAYC